MSSQGAAQVDHHREPCPHRILDDIGGAFSMGAVGGGVFHAGKSLIWGPKGYKMRTALEAVRKEAPRMGGSFAVWGGLFASFDCTLVYLRQREDPWNSITSAFLTSGLLSARMGPNAALRHAVFGGVILAMIEGLGIMIQKNTAPPPSGMPPMDMPPAEAPKPPSDVLVGASSGSLPGDLDPNLIYDDASRHSDEKKQSGGLFGLDLFGASTQ